MDQNQTAVGRMFLWSWWFLVLGVVLLAPSKQISSAIGILLGLAMMCVSVLVAVAREDDNNNR
jgi:hypothetical protein